jgi:hypothetical protein
VAIPYTVRGGGAPARGRGGGFLTLGPPPPPPHTRHNCGCNHPPPCQVKQHDCIRDVSYVSTKGLGSLVRYRWWLPPRNNKTWLLEACVLNLSLNFVDGQVLLPPPQGGLCCRWYVKSNMGHGRSLHFCRFRQLMLWMHMLVYAWPLFQTMSLCNLAPPPPNLGVVKGPGGGGGEGGQRVLLSIAFIPVPKQCVLCQSHAQQGPVLLVTKQCFLGLARPWSAK